MLDLDLLILAVLMIMLVMGTVASVGWDVQELRNRENWFWLCVLWLEAILMPNLWAALLLCTVILGLFQIGRSWYVLRSTIIPIAGMTGLYVLLVPFMHLGMIVPLLWTGTAVGLFLAAYAALGLCITRRPFRFTLKGWIGLWGIYEDLDGADRYLCGQANRMHLCALSALAMGCAAGLVWMGQWYAVPAFFICYLPQHACWKALADYGDYQPNIGHLGLIALGVFCLALYDWRYAGGLLASGLLFGTVLTIRKKPWRTKQWNWLDGGRLGYWIDTLRLVWWPAGWTARLFGFGTCTWFLKTCKMGEARHIHLFTQAHNEYVQQLLEHGIVGLVILLAYLGEAIWRNAHGLPEQQAVAMLGVVWCAIALVHFPSSLYHEYHSLTETKECWYGSPPLNTWTLLIALMAEVR